MHDTVVCIRPGPLVAQQICDLPDVINCQFHEFAVALLELGAFSVAEPTVWNSLPDHLRDPAVNSKQLRRDLKTYLFSGHSKR